MKKILLTIVLLATVTGAFSQTKEETENWIREKIFKYTSHKGGSTSEVYNTIEFTTNGYVKMRFLTITSVKYIDASYNGRGGGTSYRNKYTIRNWTFPIWAIGEVTLRSENKNGYDEGYSEYSDTFLNFNVDKYSKEYCEYKYTKARMIPNNSLSRTEQWEKYMEETEQLAFSNTVLRISFQNDPEEDFVNRFNKAIQHLKTFYPKPLKKETF